MAERRMTARDAIRIVGITPRQLEYWAHQLGILRLGPKGAYTEVTVRDAKMVLRLRALGFSLSGDMQRIMPAVAAASGADAWLITDGVRVDVVRQADVAEAAYAMRSKVTVLPIGDTRPLAVWP